MEIAEQTKERRTVILAVLTLLVIGLFLLISTVHTFRYQSEVEEEHLFLTSRAVLLSVENTVRRSPVREGKHRLSPRTSDFFQTLEQDGDVLFVGIVDPASGEVLAPPLHDTMHLTLPGFMTEALLIAGEWHGSLVLGGRKAYLYGKRMEPLRGIPMSLRDELPPPGFLVVGIDMEKRLNAYAGFRKNLLFQALYILIVGFFAWFLGTSFLARREQARKAVTLELFQAKLLDNLPDGLITLSADGTVRSANPAALRILKRESRDVLGRPASSLPGGMGECTAKKPETGATLSAWQHIAYEHAQLEVLALPLTDDEENACLLIIRDRTALRNLENSLANAEKLAAVGALAAGVAHEVRNPLSSLRGFAQYFVKKLAGCKPEEEYAKTMVREADRLNRVITDLLFLARPKVISPVKVDLPGLIHEITSLLRFDLEQKSIPITMQLNARTLFADRDCLKQALLNLVLNSLHALGKGIPAERLPSTRAPFLPAVYSSAKSNKTTPPVEDLGAGMACAASASMYPCLPDPTGQSPLRIVSGFVPGGVWIEVQDMGHGMPRNYQDKAFEAFFTAKEHGTGLGLALVQRTMLDHEGNVHIASEPGKGCTVRLLFPDQPPPPGTSNQTQNAGKDREKPI